jgi:hypothetical protein
MISEKKIKFSSNLQDEAVQKCEIQSIQVEEIVQITELHRYLLKSVWRFVSSLRPCIIPGPKWDHNRRIIIWLTMLHVECVELSCTRSNLSEIIITEKALSEFLIWVNHSPRILLGVSLRSLWVSHRPRILLGVSLRSLSSRHLRGFIYNNHY